MTDDRTPSNTEPPMVMRLPRREECSFMSSEPVLASTTLAVDEYRWNGHCYVPWGS